MEVHTYTCFLLLSLCLLVGAFNPFTFKVIIDTYETSLVAQTVMCLSTMQETQVQSLVWEDPLEEEMAIHSSTIGLENPMDRGAW